MSNLKRSLANDIKFGLSKEVDILPTLSNRWNNEINIMNTKDKYNDEYYPYDFESDGLTSWEVKSRRIGKYKFSTTIIPVHKIRNVDTEQIFVFNFTDTCSYIIYDKDLFKTFSTRWIKVEREGGNNNPVLHFEIPVNILIDIIKIYK
jgi:hypothetical protein